MNTNRVVIWIGVTIIVLLVAILGFLLYKSLTPQKMVIEVATTKPYLSDDDVNIIRAKMEICDLRKVLLAYYEIYGKYPDPQNYQGVLMKAKSHLISQNETMRVMPYLIPKEIKNDPFSVVPYVLAFSANKKHFVLYSIGVRDQGRATINDSGKVSPSGDAIWVSDTEYAHLKK